MPSSEKTENGLFEKIVKKDGNVDYYCVNPNCPRRNIEGIIHYVSRDALNIEGLGDEIVEELYNLGLVKNITDLYSLSAFTTLLD